MTNEIMNEFTKDRNNQIVDHKLVRSVCKLYVQMGMLDAEPFRSGEEFTWKGEYDLGFYKKHFQEPFLVRTRKEYDNQASSRIQALTAPDYLLWADECLEREENYCKTMLDATTREPLMDEVEQELITKRNKMIVDKDTGLKYMVDNRLEDNLRILYRCFSRREANLLCIVEEMNAYIRKEGEKIMADEEKAKDPIAFAKALLDFKKEMDRQIAYCFNSDAKFEKGRDMSFQQFLNTSQLPSLYLAIYLN